MKKKLPNVVIMTETHNCFEIKDLEVFTGN